jgi:hypothetical protein
MGSPNLYPLACVYFVERFASYRRFTIDQTLLTACRLLSGGEGAATPRSNQGTRGGDRRP